RWVTPGLVDCHTHLVFGGDRSGEFEQRLGGATYEEIARAGGGIVSSVAATRAASEDELYASALGRLAGLKATGVTTIEIKSGYGLDHDSELKMLRVARRIGREAGVRVRTSYLGLHAVPPEWRTARGRYVDLAVDDILPAAHAEGLVDAVDAYCEPIAFSTDEVGRLFDRAKALGLPVKLHADQLSDGGGAALAARYGALSADHVEHTTEAGVRAMAEAGVVAVLLPGAWLMLRETVLPPMDLFRRHGVAMAVATDCNPGTSPVASMTAAINLACVQFRLTPEEALAGATRIAARALGLQDEIGTLEAGKSADLAVWDIERPAELAYWLGKPLLTRRMIGGVWDA
ncbi:MAG TPA: imidazolonepropionase, partial [Brevundimonas sp.]|nr:imidazolonepropionase [Brevundimonas sp.]